MAARVAGRSKRWPLVAAVALGSTGCLGSVEAPADSIPGPGFGGGAAPAPVGDAPIPTSSVRRLTASEYDSTLRDLLLDDSAPARALLPEDARAPFDNDSSTQVASAALIDGAALLAADATARLRADPSRVALLLECTPTGPSDEACLRAFVTRFGRRALRRPLAQEEITLYLRGTDGNSGALDHAIEAGDFSIGVDSVVRTMLQDPEFLYRIEIGAPVTGKPGLFKLNGWEMASRLSYLLWGSTPDDGLLDRAAAGQLRTATDVRRAAETILSDPRAVERIARFHAMWLGYELLVPRGTPVGEAMWQETTALLDRVVFEEKRPWHDVFRFGETFVDAELASIDGSSMLDNTVAILLFEGGYGLDPEDNDNGATHSTENMVAMIAGRVGGLSPGRHVQLPNVHPGKLTLSAMSAVGLPERLGELTGRIPELFG